MAMPMGYDGKRTDDASERTDDVSVYRRTCIDFIHDISGDYEAWVDRYNLPADEDKRRRTWIHATVQRTCEWIAKVAQTIKAVDVVMNDGIQKMAESTAGRPLEFGVFVNKMAGYTEAKPGIIDVNVKAAAPPGKKMRLGYHFVDNRFRIESTCKARLDEHELSEGEGKRDYDMLDMHIKLHAQNANQRDVISFTITVCEIDTTTNNEINKRGLTTIVHIV